MKRPELFIVGAMKSGTTSLYAWLKQHPDVFMPDIKEPHFFCRDFHEESDEFHRQQSHYPIRDEDAYLALFADRGDEAVAGEASTTSLYSAVAAQEICRFNPDARIVALLREPVDLIYSLHDYMLFYHEETIPSFREALEAETGRRQNGANLPDRVRQPSRLFYSEIGRLADQVQRYLDRFPSEQILLIPFDDLKADAAGVYRRVLQFLSVDDQFQPQLTAENVARTHRYHWIKWLLSDPNASFKVVARRVAPRLYRFAGRALARLNAQKGKKEPLDPELRRELQEVFRTQVESLSILTNRDLVKLWGYDAPVEQAIAKSS